jgi:hypothetical protein
MSNMVGVLPAADMSGITLNEGGVDQVVAAGLTVLHAKLVEAAQSGKGSCELDRAQVWASPVDNVVVLIVAQLLYSQGYEVTWTADRIAISWENHAVRQYLTP